MCIRDSLGSGLYLKKGGTAYKMVPQGEGLYLKPHRGTDLSSLGDGLYIKSGTGFIDGRGLLLGQNNPISTVLKNIPNLRFCEHNKKWKANKQTTYH